MNSSCELLPSTYPHLSIIIPFGGQLNYSSIVFRPHPSSPNSVLFGIWGRCPKDGGGLSCSSTLEVLPLLPPRSILIPPGRPHSFFHLGLLQLLPRPRTLAVYPAQRKGDIGKGVQGWEVFSSRHRQPYGFTQLIERDAVGVCNFRQVLIFCFRIKKRA